MLDADLRDQLIEYMHNDAYRPLTVQELVSVFAIDGSADFREFVKLLNGLEEDGTVVRTRTNRYGVPERMNLIVGKLQMKARGYGFVLTEDREADLYISSSDMNGAMSGDKVMARVERSGTGPHQEGKIIRVLERAANRIVGRFTKHRDHGFVSPADKRFPQDIFVSAQDMLDAHDGYMVVVEITAFPTATRGPEGKIIEVLGHPDEPGIDILAIVRKYDLPETFPEVVLSAAETIPMELTAADLEGRRDLRDETIVTIDGEDAKDLDDAVHVKRLGNGHYLLGVHIADVGYYVKEGSALDKEAFKRGTSVYLVDRVIPMLPQRLSNYICSLNPKVDRLTLSCMMEIDENGGVVHHEIFPSVICTTERMTYTNVRKIVNHEDSSVTKQYATLVPMFELMRELALILREKRMRRGAIDFDFEEVKVVVDEIGTAVDIVPRQRSIAERMIEEFMLAANETVAEHFQWMNVPFVYRIHEEPDTDRMIEFNQFVHNFGYHVKGVGNKIHPRALQAILESAEGTREAPMISSLMLRSMRQARYAPECVGHFGLAAEYYTHFTSPIRRYPDLMIHRIMREVLLQGLSAEREQVLRDRVSEGSKQSSERERIAQDAERECDQLKMVEYMLAHLEEEFDGLISGVTQFGLFVQLTNGVEGLIHVSYLTDDYYVLNERQMALVGERTRRVFRLGDPVRVKVVSASKSELSIDFDLLAHHREGTMVWSEQGGSIIYDEDLTPTERKERIKDREMLGAEYRTRRGQRERGGFEFDARGGSGESRRGRSSRERHSLERDGRRQGGKEGERRRGYGGYAGPTWASTRSAASDLEEGSDERRREERFAYGERGFSGGKSSGRSANRSNAKSGSKPGGKKFNGRKRNGSSDSRSSGGTTAGGGGFGFAGDASSVGMGGRGKPKKKHKHTGFAKAGHKAGKKNKGPKG